MKKFLILAATAVLSACACFSSNDSEPQEQVVYAKTVTAPAGMDCDYFENNTCYRYVHRQAYYPATVQYRQSARTYAEVPAPAPVACAPAVVDSGCAPKVRETREPVEITYKKTTYKTVYNPQTYTSVSYEKVPYASAPVAEPVIVNNNEDVLVEVK